MNIYLQLTRGVNSIQLQLQQWLNRSDLIIKVLVVGVCLSNAVEVILWLKTLWFTFNLIVQHQQRPLKLPAVVPGERSAPCVKLSVEQNPFVLKSSKTGKPSGFWEIMKNTWEPVHWCWCTMFIFNKKSLEVRNK